MRPSRAIEYSPSSSTANSPQSQRDCVPKPGVAHRATLGKPSDYDQPQRGCGPSVRFPLVPRLRLGTRLSARLCRPPATSGKPPIRRGSNRPKQRHPGSQQQCRNITPKQSGIIPLHPVQKTSAPPSLLGSPRAQTPSGHAIVCATLSPSCHVGQAPVRRGSNRPKQRHPGSQQQCRNITPKKIRHNPAPSCLKNLCASLTFRFAA